MKSPNRELRAWVYDKLRNHITVSGYTGNVPVVSVPQKSQSLAFVMLGNISLADFSTKTEYLTKATFEINVITVFADENTSYTLCENISSEVLDLLIDIRGAMTNFKIIAARFVSSSELYEQGDTQKAISNQINIEFTIEEI